MTRARVPNSLFPLRRSEEEGGGERRWEEPGGDPLTSYKLMVYSAQQRAGEQRRKYKHFVALVGWLGYTPHPLDTDPVILQRLVALLSSDVLSDAMVARGLAAIKEEWMKYVGATHWPVLRQWLIIPAAR